MHTSVRKERKERLAERHCVNHQHSLVGQLEPDDLEKVPRFVGPDEQHFGWVSVGFEVDNGDGVLDRVLDLQCVEAMLECRTV